MSPTGTARHRCCSQLRTPVAVVQDLPKRRRNRKRFCAFSWSMGPRERCLLWVKLRRTQYEHMLPALPSNSDIARRSRHVSNVPTTEVSLSLNHLVGEREKRRDREAERRSLERLHGLARGLARGFQRFASQKNLFRPMGWGTLVTNTNFTWRLPTRSSRRYRRGSSRSPAVERKGDCGRRDYPCSALFSGTE